MCRILIIGCGNSSLGYDLWKEGYHNIDNIDYAESVIQRMKDKYSEGGECQELRWQCMDMMNMEYENGLFDIVIDKATMDVVMTDNKDPWNPSEQVRERAKKTLQNCYRVLKDDGLFIQISFDQPHFRTKLLLDPEFEWDFS